MRISVFESPQLQATILAMKGMDRELAAQVRKATKSVTAPEWQRALGAYASTPLEQAVLVKSARVAVSDKNVSLRSGQLSTKMAGGARLFELTPGAEFGATQRPIQAKSAAGTTYTRRRGQAFRRRNLKGYVANQAAADVIPRIAALWVATVVRTFHETLEKGAR